MTKHAEDREYYKIANRIVKESQREKENDVKYKEVDNMVGGSRLVEISMFSKEFAE
jgi:hypothetical protein